jgi:hypothetical protein
MILRDEGDVCAELTSVSNRKWGCGPKNCSRPYVDLIPNRDFRARFVKAARELEPAPFANGYVIADRNSIEREAVDVRVGANINIGSYTKLAFSQELAATPKKKMAL